jgi:hypothetical protein
MGDMTVTRILAIVLATSVLAACAGGDGDAARPGTAGAATSTPGGAATSAPGRPSGTAGAGDRGIGAGAARTGGVFSAPYDAALRGTDHATAGRTTLRLINTGQKADSYRISVRPAGAATLTPATAELDPGAGTELRLRLTADVTVHVFSVGRGAEVADLPITLN